MKLIEPNRKPDSNRRDCAPVRSYRFDKVDAGVGDPTETCSIAAANAYQSTSRRHVKRLMDVSLAAIILVSILPVLIVIAVAIKLVSKGPVFYGQSRLGKSGKPFRIWKFRTMFVDAEHRLDEYLGQHPDLVHQWITTFKLQNDPRVIPWVGNALRTTGLDELPQLWNVLKGEMSLVGPRPLPQYHVDHFGEEFRRLRVEMPPGITGQWQVSSRNDGAVDAFQKWDTYYVCNWSIRLDLKILFRTTFVVLRGGSAKRRIRSETSRFNGNPIQSSAVPPESRDKLPHKSLSAEQCQINND
ncbi:MAG: sugar transferase [Planctomycetales bacterium]|nr:sugar transferase [Planctomycetales bacterium]